MMPWIPWGSIRRRLINANVQCRRNPFLLFNAFHFGGFIFVMSSPMSFRLSPIHAHNRSLFARRTKLNCAVLWPKKLRTSEWVWLLGRNAKRFSIVSFSLSFFSGSTMLARAMAVAWKECSLDGSKCSEKGNFDPDTIAAQAIQA